EPVTVTITVNSTSAGVLQFATATESVDEDAGTITITVVRTDGSTGPVSVKYSVLGGTATSGADYVLDEGTIDFADGEMTRTIVVTIVDDGATEDDETITISLSDPTGGATV